LIFGNTLALGQSSVDLTTFCTVVLTAVLLSGVVAPFAADTYDKTEADFAAVLQEVSTLVVKCPAFRDQCDSEVLSKIAQQIKIEEVKASDEPIEIQDVYWILDGWHCECDLLD
jgi:hypothetical protein